MSCVTNPSYDVHKQIDHGITDQQGERISCIMATLCAICREYVHDEFHKLFFLL